MVFLRPLLGPQSQLDPGSRALRHLLFERLTIIFASSRAQYIGAQAFKGAGSFHIHRKTEKELGTLAVLGVRERPNLAQNLVTHRH